VGQFVPAMFIVSLLTRQVYYEPCILEEQKLLKQDLLIQQVIGYRELQPRIGGRK
jgi:putative transposase